MVYKDKGCDDQRSQPQGPPGRYQNKAEIPVKTKVIWILGKYSSPMDAPFSAKGSVLCVP